jgi:CheY-like chemotaxis protein
MKFLIIDDDHVSRMKMQAILEDFGDCFTVKNGRDALAVFSKNIKKNTFIEVITLDIVMPGMDRTEMLYNIRDIENKNKVLKKNQVKIIMVTSHSDKDHIITCLQAGCDDYVIKPFNLDSITKKLDKLGIKKERQSLTPKTSYKN